MVKHVEGWKLSKNVDGTHRVYVRSFSSAKVKCMNDYVKPYIRENNPDHVIIHIGTNELDSERQGEIYDYEIYYRCSKKHKNKHSYSQYIRYSPTEWQLQ